jgi:DHA1 family bicyclomycin/chloramphenicol resistance-like MFS transporter
MGHIAGVASSFQGFVSMVGATLIGFVVGQAFNGTVVPMEAGYLLCGLCALAAVLAAERGRLFQPQDIPDARHALAE